MNIIYKKSVLKQSICLVCLSLFICFSFDSNILFPSLPYVDSSVFRYGAMLMKKGGVIYRDMFDHKGPVVYLVNYLGYCINPENGIWFIEFTAILLTSFFSLKIFRLFLNTNSSLLGTSFSMLLLYPYFITGGNLVEEYALPLITISLLFFLDYLLNGRTTALRILVCGICFSGIVLIRPNMIATWLVFCTIIAVEEIRNKTGKIYSFILWFILGAIIMVIPFLVYLMANHALSDYFYDCFVFNGLYSGDQASYRFHAAMHFFSMSSVSFSTIIIAINILTHQTSSRFSKMWLIYIIVSLPLVALSGRDYEHYGIILVPISIYPIALVIDYLNRNAYNKRLLFVAELVALFCLSYPYFDKGLSKIHAGRPEETLEGVIAAFIENHTSEDETIIASGTRDVFYVLSDRLSASKYSYQSPIAEIDNNIYDYVINDLSESLPAFIVLDLDPCASLSTKEMNKRLEQFAEENNYANVRQISPYMLYFR